MKQSDTCLMFCFLGLIISKVSTGFFAGFFGVFSIFCAVMSIVWWLYEIKVRKAERPR